MVVYQYIFYILGIFLQLSVLVWSLSKNADKNVDNFCYSKAKDHPQRQHYSLETSYPVIEANDYHKVDGCTPEKIWIISRHGTRYPSGNKMDKLKHKLPHIRKEIRKNPNLCKSDYDMIQDWNMNKTKTACGLVWHQGWDDLHQMAQTYKDKYPNLFNGPYSPKTYSFIHSSAHRTKQSCEAFVDELFGEKVMEDSQKNWKTDDMLLRPWSLCSEFSKYVHSLDDEVTQMEMFMDSKRYQDIRKKVSKRLGMKHVLGHTDLSYMWDECRYQQAYHIHEMSPWCAAFDLNDAIILEYLGDLDLYYKYSYGSELAKKLPCTTVKSMIDTMTDSSTSPKVTALFTHAELLSMLITALGGKHDAEPLLASNFEKQQNRQYRSSKLVPYASSLAAIKYNCVMNVTDSSFTPSSVSNFSSSSAEKVINEPLVVLMLNQEQFVVPWCKGKYICTLPELTEMFMQSQMKNCPYGICGAEFVKSKGAVAKYTC